ncbi:MAG TPA: DUF4097 family beta strand repeat-containing protein [Actinocrinis sp.]|jgi:hypothetical protein
MGTWSTIGEFTEDPYRIEFDEPVRSLRLAAIAGKVNIVGSDGPPSIEVARATEQPVRITLEGGELVVKHGEDRRPGVLNWLCGGRRMTAELSLAVPPDCLVDARLVSGPLTVSNFHERVEIKGVSGDVTLAEVHGRARVGTVSGAVTVEQVTGDLSVKAASGEITVLGGTGGTIDVSAISGAIMIDLEDPVPSSVKLHCISGAIKVRLPHEPDVDVDLVTSNGRVASAFDEVGVLNGHGTSGVRRLSGRIGSGEARLYGKTVSGSVTLLRRGPMEDSAEPEDAVPEPDNPDNTAPGDIRDQVPDNQNDDDNNEDAR